MQGLKPSPEFTKSGVLQLGGTRARFNKQPRVALTPTKALHDTFSQAFTLATATPESLLQADQIGAAAPLVIPLLAVAGIAAAKATSYSQLEVVRAAMLSRHVKPGGARVLQLGGNTKDLFYYPQGTVQVTVIDPDVSVSLWETAGMNASVPVNTVKSDIAAGLAAQAGSSYDSIVAINHLSSNTSEVKSFIKQVQRLLKPGGTFVFIQKINTSSSPLSGLVRIGSSGEAVDASIPDSIADLVSWDFIQWDAACEGLDPHAAGVAIKSLNSSGDDFSADRAVFEQVMSSRKRKGGAKSGKGGGFK